MFVHSRVCRSSSLPETNATKMTKEIINMTEHKAKQPHYAPTVLRHFAGMLFQRAGLQADKAETVAELLVEADLMGHTTHGLGLADRYLQAIVDGSMRAAGDPEIISDRGACMSWNGRHLPGVWLTAQAVDLAVERVTTYGTVTVAIGNSHHIGCLAVYLPRATAKGFMVIIASSDPSAASVAPFGGTRALFTPNPIAVGIPTDGAPILIDTSASITTNNMSARLIREGRRFPHPWLLDDTGQPTDDPSVLQEQGTILPAGGLDHGQKGYSWALLVEALTQGLAGFGRADGPTEWSASVFVQVIDPSAFAGSAAFTRQTGWLANACRSNPPRPGVERVRVPGEQALVSKDICEREGLALYPGILNSLRLWAERLDVPYPQPLG